MEDPSCLCTWPWTGTCVGLLFHVLALLEPALLQVDSPRGSGGAGVAPHLLGVVSGSWGAKGLQGSQLGPGPRVEGGDSSRVGAVPEQGPQAGGTGTGLSEVSVESRELWFGVHYELCCLPLSPVSWLSPMGWAGLGLPQEDSIPPGWRWMIYFTGTNNPEPPFPDHLPSCRALYVRYISTKLQSTKLSSIQKQCVYR